jgi:hypothetical protein
MADANPSPYSTKGVFQAKRFLGGIMPHEVAPACAGQERIVAINCYRAQTADVLDSDPLSSTRSSLELIERDEQPSRDECNMPERSGLPELRACGSVCEAWQDDSRPHHHAV